jgi:hypothetical protein
MGSVFNTLQAGAKKGGPPGGGQLNIYNIDFIEFIFDKIHRTPIYPHLLIIGRSGRSWGHEADTETAQADQQAH